MHDRTTQKDVFESEQTSDVTRLKAIFAFYFVMDFSQTYNRKVIDSGKKR